MSSKSSANMNDPFGLAILDFYKKGKCPDIKVDSNYTENENIKVAYLFRKEDEMPDLERTALKRCKGKILDVGAAAGCHSIVLQKKGYNVTALDKSELATQVMKMRGIQKVVCSDIFEFENNSFDTILLLMNGSGIAGTIQGLTVLIKHLAQLLTDTGQILMDSSDIKYLFEEEDGSSWVDLNNDRYYGEMQYKVKYKSQTDEFDWLFVDYNMLNKIVSDSGLKCELIIPGNENNFLARISLK